MKKVITYGTFDLFHVGHLNILKRAKALGDYLIVAVSSDAFNAQKGKKAYHSDQDRMAILKAIKYVATQGDKGVVKCEIKDMLNMDIPYFYLNTSGKSLFGSEGEKIEDYFEYTSLEHLKKKIVLLDEDDLKDKL